MASLDDSFPSQQIDCSSFTPIVDQKRINDKSLPPIPYRVCGNFPFEKFKAGSFPKLSGPHTWWVEIYPLLENPELCGMVAQDACYHPEAHAIYHRALRQEALSHGEDPSITFSKLQLLDNNYVDAFIRSADGQITVELRPSNGQEELSLRAINLLETYGFKDEQILFISDETNFDCIANLGMLHKVKLLSVHNESEVNKFIESNTIHTENGINYLYQAGKGLRYITPDEVKALTFSIDDPEVFKAKIAEIAAFIHRDESAVSKRHADFLVIKNYSATSTVDTLREQFSDLDILVSSIDDSQWNERKHEVFDALKKLYTNHVNMTDEPFRSDAPNDPQWAFFIARILIGKTYDSKGLDLGTNLLGGTHILAGGMIGYHDSKNILHYGTQTFNSIADVLIKYPQLGEISGHNCNQLRNNSPIILSPTDKENSVLVFIPSAELRSRMKIVVKKYIFHSETDDNVKALMNFALEANLKISNSFVSQIRISRDRRDPEPDLIQQLGANSHNVYILGVTEPNGPSKAISYTRYEKIGYGIEQLIENFSKAGRKLSQAAAENISELHMQFKLLQAFALSPEVFPEGPRVPLLTTAILPVNVSGKPNRHEEYFRRIFLEGESLRTVNRLQNNHIRLSLPLADELGLLKAYDIFSRRRNHRDGDEIIVREDGQVRIRMASARSAFPPPSKIPADDPYGAGINLVSSHLAADVAACRWMERNTPGPDEFKFSDSYLSIVIDSTATNLANIKKTIYSRGDEIVAAIRKEFDFEKLELMKAEFGADSDEVEIMNFPACFEKSVEDIKAVNIQDFTNRLAANVNTLANFYEKVISGLQTASHVDHILKHAEGLLGSNSWYTDLPITHQLLRIPVESDPNWPKYDMRERLELLSTLRVSAWMKKVRLATDNEKLDLEEIASAAKTFQLITARRHEAVKSFSADLIRRSPQITLSSDTISYFYDALTSRKMGKTSLEKLGYLFY